MENPEIEILFLTINIITMNYLTQLPDHLFMKIYKDYIYSGVTEQLKTLSVWENDFMETQYVWIETVCLYGNVYHKFYRSLRTSTYQYFIPSLPRYYYRRVT